MKLCKDCKWCSSDREGFFSSKISKFSKCGYEESGSRYVLVTGNVNDSNDYCATQRGSEYLCGKDAKWFEPKDTNA